MGAFDRQASLVRPPWGFAKPRHDDVASGLILAWVPGIGELMQRYAPALGANGDLRAYDHGGYTLRGNGSANVASIPFDGSPYTQLTITAIVRVDAWAGAGNFNLLWELTADGNANVGGLTAYSDGTGANITLGRRIGTGAYGRTYARPAAAQWHVISTVFDNEGADSATDSANLRFFVNGVRQVATTIPAGGNNLSFPAAFANSTLHVLSRNAASLPTTGDVAGLFVHGRKLEDSELEQLGENLSAPWRLLFEPTRIWVPLSAGVTFPTLGTPTFVPGSLTTSGFRPRLPLTW